MIKKRLQLIYQNGPNEKAQDLFFNSWKEIHMHLFEHGLYPEFQVTDQYGKKVLYYADFGYGECSIRWTEKVPGSVVFEIVNKHASAKL